MGVYVGEGREGGCGMWEGEEGRVGVYVGEGREGGWVCMWVRGGKEGGCVCLWLCVFMGRRG